MLLLWHVLRVVAVVQRAYGTFAMACDKMFFPNNAERCLERVY